MTGGQDAHCAQNAASRDGSRCEPRQLSALQTNQRMYFYAPSRVPARLLGYRLLPNAGSVALLRALLVTREGGSIPWSRNIREI